MLFAAIAWLWHKHSAPSAQWIEWLIPVAAVAAFAAQIATTWNLADEVIDHGDHLRVRRGRIEESVAIADIEKVSVEYAIRPIRVGLALRKPGAFGRRIVFVPSPNSAFGTYGESRVAADLSRRIGARAPGESVDG
ncbi:hypothetical protein [Lysobacter capsici]|uniref:hypothetical protein n=1 Tax=Lysobacter capsici TaxID=435897 RepID=UPI0011E01B57|nr:hypothetical protein [Lysobacter capsici]